jgi:DNA-binding MarR family transcriptional regulator
VKPKQIAEEDRATFRRLHEVRAATLEHYFLARKLSAQRGDLIKQLLAAGYSQADIGREMGVTRQAVQKMLKADEANKRAEARAG